MRWEYSPQIRKCSSRSIFSFYKFIATRSDFYLTSISLAIPVLSTNAPINRIFPGLTCNCLTCKIFCSVLDKLLKKKDNLVKTGKYTKKTFFENYGTLLCLFIVIVLIIVGYILIKRAQLYVNIRVFYLGYV